MSVKTFSQCGAALLLVVLVSGCSGTSPATPAFINECRWDRNRCMYEGSYETGERDYAEEEAKRLNRAASARLRRGSR